MIKLLLKTRELVVFLGYNHFCFAWACMPAFRLRIFRGISSPSVYLSAFPAFWTVLNKFIKYKKPANLAFMRLAGCLEMVPKRGLEPLCLAAQVPETCVSTNFTTWADEKI